jgi:hypothetical protein
MRVDIVKITPQLAKEWLEQNVNFRDPLPSKIQQYANDMIKGWDENGETIKFNERDELVDGQNRLLACVKADKPFTSVVVYGVKSDINVDMGKKRTLNEWLKHHGIETYATDVAASLRAIYRIRNGRVGPEGKDNIATNNQLVALLKANPKIKDSVVAIQPVKRLLNGAIASSLHFTFSAIDAEMTEKYFKALQSPDGLDGDDPVYQLREKLIENKVAKYKLSDRQKCALAIIAWNYWRKGSSVKNLRWVEAGPTKQDFPVIE